MRDVERMGIHIVKLVRLLQKMDCDDARDINSDDEIIYDGTAQ